MIRNSFHVDVIVGRSGLFFGGIFFVSDAKVWVSDGLVPVIFSVLTRTSHRGISYSNFSALSLLVSGTSLVLA